MNRLIDAWRELQAEQRRIAFASLGLFVSMFLPWYDKTDTVVVRDTARATQTSLSAFEAFSFVEAAVLLVSAGVLAMLFARGEHREFTLPGGDGLIVMLAGGWTALLIFYRLLDKPGLQGNERITATVGVQWGIFVALLLALALMYAGARMRATAHHPAQPGPAPRRPRSSSPRSQEPPAQPRGSARHERRQPLWTPPQWDDSTDENATAITRAPAGAARGGGAPSSAPVPASPLPGELSAGEASAADGEGGEPTAPTRAASEPAAEPAAAEPAPADEAETEQAPARDRPRYPPAPPRQMSFEDAPGDRQR